MNVRAEQVVIVRREGLPDVRLRHTDGKVNINSGALFSINLDAQELVEALTLLDAIPATHVTHVTHVTRVDRYGAGWHASCACGWTALWSTHGDAMEGCRQHRLAQGAPA